jgi:hypothetical protein
MCVLQRILFTVYILVFLFPVICSGFIIYKATPLYPSSRLVRYSTRSDADSEDTKSTVTGVTLKIALDATGGAADMAAEKSDRFTCAESLDMVHRLRRVSDAVLVGKKTVVVDDPSLTVRRVPCDGDEQPLRVVLDPQLTLILDDVVEQDYALFRDGLPTVVYHCVPDVDDSLLDLDESVTLVYHQKILLCRSLKWFRAYRNASKSTISWSKVALIRRFAF